MSKVEIRNGTHKDIQRILIQIFQGLEIAFDWVRCLTAFTFYSFPSNKITWEAGLFVQ